MHRSLQRMARLRADGFSFGAAVALDLDLGHANPGRRSPGYNGAGLAGDWKAVEADFTVALRRRAPLTAGGVQ